MDKAKPVKLTNRRVREAKPDLNGKWRRIGDLLCQGLKLVITPEGTKRWAWRYSRLNNKGPTEMGLGVWPDISLDRARDIANQLRRIRADGRDPQELKERNVLEGMTLRQVSEEWLEKRRPYKSESWLREKRNLLFFHSADLMDLLPFQVKPETIDKALSPVRQDRPGQAERARATLVQIFNNAKSRRIFFGDNPADREIQVHLSPQVPRKEKHYHALPHDQVPTFVQDLCRHEARSVAAVALHFLILTATRTGEVLGAQWDEIKDDVWTIPPERMKVKNATEHRVPLSKQAMALIDLRKRFRNDSDFIFTGPSQEPLHERTMRSLLEYMGFKGKATVHGFRSSFRDWCAEEGKHFAAAELCLAHTAWIPTGGAYFRTDLLKERREIMEAWAKFCG